MNALNIAPELARCILGSGHDALGFRCMYDLEKQAFYGKYTYFRVKKFIDS